MKYTIKKAINYIEDRLYYINGVPLCSKDDLLKLITESSQIFNVDIDILKLCYEI